MRTETAPVVVQKHDIPETIRALDALHANYVDLFTATTDLAAEASAEEWARAGLEGASPTGRFLAWQVLLGLRLDSRPSPGRVAGWAIAGSGDSWVRLEASSWFLTANMIFRVDGDSVSFATLIRYDRSVAAVVWTPVSAIHRRLAPGVLLGAVKRVGRRRRPAR